MNFIVVSLNARSRIISDSVAGWLDWNCALAQQKDMLSLCASSAGFGASGGKRGIQTGNDCCDAHLSRERQRTTVVLETGLE